MLNEGKAEKPRKDETSARVASNWEMFDLHFFNPC
jgi:hypothetical protein